MAADCSPTTEKDIALDDLRRAKKRIRGMSEDMHEALENGDGVKLGSDAIKILADIMEDINGLIESAEERIRKL